MKTRDITVSVTLDWAPMLAQLDALAGHVRALVEAGGGATLAPSQVWAEGDRCPNPATGAPQSDERAEKVPVEPETENGPQNGARGRIGWLLLYPGDDGRLLVHEAPGGWTDSNRDEYPVWPAEDWPDAEFTPIRILADDEVAVKRDVVRAAEALWPRARAAALEAGEDA